MVDRVELGTAAVTRVVEWQVDQLPLTLFPETPPTAWRELATEYTPTFWEGDLADRVDLGRRGGRLTVLVDTGVGNDRDRRMPPLDHLNTDFLDSLQRAGVEADVVDVVVNTHIHSDHVGWNTKRDGNSWVPTFPNARYLIPEADYRFFHPDNADARPAARTVFEDSILPVDEAGQVELWSDDHQISESLRLRPAPGHTPGSSVLWLDAGRPAVFVGDLTHSPLQLHRPADPCAFDDDLAAAAVTRKRVLTEATRRRAAVIPAHYPGHGGVTVVARGDSFIVDDWLEITPI